nr:hypothetical protein [Sicyoidochytrium minutum DNA virus]
MPKAVVLKKGQKVATGFDKKQAKEKDQNIRKGADKDKDSLKKKEEKPVRAVDVNGLPAWRKPVTIAIWVFFGLAIVLAIVALVLYFTGTPEPSIVVVPESNSADGTAQSKNETAAATTDNGISAGWTIVIVVLVVVVLAVIATFVAKFGLVGKRGNSVSAPA